MTTRGDGLDLAVVTVSYNTRDLLRESLRSVLSGLEHSRLTGQVWVVDNASADGSAEMVRASFPQVHLIAHGANVGFAAGNNLAVAAMGKAQGDRARHVLFLNPDTLVLGDALRTLVQFLDATPTAGAAGPRLVNPDGSFQHSAFRFPGLMQIALDLFPIHPRLVDSRLNGRYPRKLYSAARPFAIDHPLGAALMVRMETLRQVGAFDEQFFMYCEEIDLCRRIKARGWQIYCVPQAAIVHLVAQSTRQLRERMFVALWRSRFLMFQKHEGKAFNWAARRLVRLGLRAAAYRDVRAHRRGELEEHELAARLAAYREVSAW